MWKDYGPQRLYWDEEKKSWESNPSKNHVWNEEVNDWIRVEKPGDPKDSDPKKE